MWKDLEFKWYNWKIYDQIGTSAYDFFGNIPDFSWWTTFLGIKRQAQ